jgi:Asp-tRNA(Asn)/Glu-tRNA(Gln) amidotransferase A subunit family amidase
LESRIFMTRRGSRRLLDSNASRTGFRRTVEDVALVLDVVAENIKGRPARYVDAMTQRRTVRIGVAENFRSDDEVSEVFRKAVEVICGLARRASLPR